MTRETKIGLLLGMGVILLIGIIISDQLSQVRQDEPADFTGFAADAQRSIDASDATPQGYGPSTPVYAPGAAPATDPANVTDVPGDFFIPEDVQPQLPQRMADGRVDQSAADGRPVPAFNVDGQSTQGAPPSRPDDGVQTLTIGNPNPQLPHYNVPIERSQEPARTPTPNTAAADASVIRHTVQTNETLFKIAQRYYGDGEYWRAIALANPERVTRDGGVYAGTVLLIPKREDAVLNVDFVPVGQETVLRVDAGGTSRTAGGSARTISVVSGDTLSGLASEHLGSAAKWQELLEFNRDQLETATDLRAGMTLKLPGSTAAPRTADTTRGNNATASRSGGGTYKVKANDNLTDIAEKTLGDGGKWRLIFDANRDKLKDPDRLVVGQELRIPG